LNSKSVPIELDVPSDAELERRAAAPRSEFVDAGALLAAIDEADGRRRYTISEHGTRNRDFAPTLGEFIARIP
jgi:hypothetical protein